MVKVSLEKVMSAMQKIMQQERAQGRAEGLEEGLQKGLQKGRKNMLNKLVEMGLLKPEQVKKLLASSKAYHNP